MAKRLDRIPRTMVRGLTMLLTLALLLGGDWAMRPVTEQQSFLGVQPAHAAEGCGTGSNTSYTMETYEKGGGQYFFTQDTCKANATATTLRDRANDQDFCATRFGTGATLFSLLSLVFQNIGRLSGLGALEGFAIAGDCGVARGMYTSVANKIQKANQACGTQGISYQMRVRRESLEVFDFQCEPTGDKSLAPDDTAFITAALVQGPKPNGGDECGVSAEAPYYTNSRISDQETGYYRNTYIGDASDGSRNYQQAQWNYDTGEYDVDQGTVTRCTPPPAAATRTIEVVQTIRSLATCTGDGRVCLDPTMFSPRDETTTSMSTLVVPPGGTVTVEPYETVDYTEAYPSPGPTCSNLSYSESVKDYFLRGPNGFSLSFNGILTKTTLVARDARGIVTGGVQMRNGVDGYRSYTQIWGVYKAKEINRNCESIEKLGEGTIEGREILSSSWSYIP